jgi:hypothetical protein
VIPPTEEESVICIPRKDKIPRQERVIKDAIKIVVLGLDMGRVSRCRSQ